MKSNTLIFLAAGALAIAGCSSTPTRVDKGPIQAKTFSFVQRPTQPPGYTDNRQAVHTMVQEAVTKRLATQGVAKVATGGDITVGYLLIVGNNATTERINDYFGYGEIAADLHDKAHAAYTGSKNPNFFEAGTLVIDISDSKSFKLLKRGYASRPVLRDLTDDARAGRIQQVVDEILRDLQIAR